MMQNTENNIRVGGYVSWHHVGNPCTHVSDPPYGCLSRFRHGTRECRLCDGETHGLSHEHSVRVVHECSRARIIATCTRGGSRRFRHGQTERCRRDGTRHWTKTYSWGKRDGEWIWFRRNGTIRKRKVYLNGVAISIETWRHDGTKKYRRDLRTGRCIIWDRRGMPRGDVPGFELWTAGAWRELRLDSDSRVSHLPRDIVDLAAKYMERE